MADAIVADATMADATMADAIVADAIVADALVADASVADALVADAMFDAYENASRHVVAQHVAMLKAHRSCLLSEAESVLERALDRTSRSSYPQACSPIASGHPGLLSTAIAAIVLQQAGQRHMTACPHCSCNMTFWSKLKMRQVTSDPQHHSSTGRRQASSSRPCGTPSRSRRSM